MKTKTRFFLYGTLKRNQCRNSVLNGQKFLGEAVTEPKYKMYNVGSFPALVQSESGTKIKGELWEIDFNLVSTLDRIEGVPYFYDRKKIKLESHPDEDVETYIFQRSTDGLKDVGDNWDDNLSRY